MARRVNTKFVIALSATMAAVVLLTLVVTLGPRLYRAWKERDPEYLNQRAQTLEKSSQSKATTGDAKGSLNDLKDACEYYAMAGTRMSHSHAPGADRLYMHAASLAETISKTADSQEDAVRFYQTALSLWKTARRENPRNLEVHQKLMDEQYQNIQYWPTLANYAELEDTATSLLKIDNSMDAKIHLAESKIVRLGQNLRKTAPTEEFDKVIEDLNGILKDNPKSGEAMALRARAKWMRGIITAAQLNIETDAQHAEDTVGYVKMISDLREELTGYLTKYGIQAEVADMLASIAQEEYVLAVKHKDNLRIAAAKAAAALGPKAATAAASAPAGNAATTQPDNDEDLAKRDEALTWLEKAYAADPSKTYIGNKLGELYRRIGQAEKSEALYKQMAAREPEKPMGYDRLGEYYTQTGQTEKAIEAYKNVRSHNSRGSFRESFINDELQRNALFSLAWLQLDLVQRSGINSDAGKAAAKESADDVEKLRATNPIKGILDLLDGRVQMLNGKYTQAISTLHSAEGTLNNQRTLAYFAKTELLLADANIALNQPGIALELIDKAIDTKTLDTLQTIVSLQKKGSLFLQVGRFLDAVQLMDGLLGRDRDTGEFKNADKMPPQLAQVLMNIRSRAMLADSGSTGTPANQRDIVLQQMRESGDVLQLAQVELSDGDFDAARTDALAALEKKTSNTINQNQLAYQIAITANVRANHKEDAKKIAAEALAAFPESATFQAFKAELDMSGDANSPEAQKRVIATITDDYIRQTALGSLALQQNQFDEAIDDFKKAEDFVNASPGDNKDKLASIVDRIFSLALFAAEKSTEPAKQKHYWDVGQDYANKAERSNLDGLSGKLFLGRLAFSKSKGKEGIQFLEQAVAQRPDYAIARVVLGQKYFQLATELGAPDTRQRNLDAALDQFREAIRLAPNNLSALQYAIEILLRKADKTSQNEAMGYLATGKALAPGNRTFAAYNDLLETNPAKAIQTREAIYEKDKSDMNNLRRLSVLYVRNNEPKKAIEKVLPIVQSNPKDFSNVDLLARLYGEATDYDTALKLYEPFLASASQDERYAALMSEADLYKKMPDKVREAAMAYVEAVKLESAKSDEAERRLGDMYFERNYYVEAESVYNNIIAKAVDSNARDRVIWRLIETMLRQNTQEKTAAAEKLLDDTLRARPDDKQGLILRAFAKIIHNDAPAAIASLDRVLRLDPNNVSAMYYRALAHVNQRNLDAAIQDLVAARAVQRDSVDVRMLLADLYRQTRQYGEASIEFTEILALHPDMVRIHSAYVNFLMELARIEAKLPIESDDDTVITIRGLKPSDKLELAIKDAWAKFGLVQWPLMYGELQGLLGKNDLAHRYFKSLNDQYGSKSLDLRNAYFDSFLAVGDYKGAVDFAPSIIGDVEKVSNDYPQFASAYVTLAKASLQLKNQGDAAKNLDKAFSIGAAIAKKTKDYSLYLMLINKAVDEPAAIPQGTLAEVLAARATADPNELIARVAQFKMLGLENKVDEALSIANSLKLPTDDKPLRMLALRERSVLELRAKQYAAAEKDFLEILQLNPYDVECLNNYAFMLADYMHQPDKGITFAKRALDVLDTHSTATEVVAMKPSVLDTLGWAQYLHGDNDAAMDTIRRATKLQPIPSAYLHLARAYKKAGQSSARHIAEEGQKLAIAAKDDSLPELTALVQELSSATSDDKGAATQNGKVVTTQTGR